VGDFFADANNTTDWDNEILYCGYRLDAETGLYHIRFRMYHPTLGRRAQRDVLGYLDAMNLYQYTLSDPAYSARGNMTTVPTPARLHSP